MRARGRSAGYTLIEIMMVVAIIAILMSIFIVGLQKYRQRAYEEGTRALLDKIRVALTAYEGEYRELPPDGFSKPVTRLVGNSPVAIKGSACLIYFLACPTIKETEVGEDRRLTTIAPFLRELKESEISGDGDLDQKLNSATNEIIDPYGNPIHYDRVLKDPQNGQPEVDDQSAASRHTMPGFVADRMHGPDPRRGAGGAIQTKNAGTYDLWSHGSSVEDPQDDITNWKD
jgi:prepilin-type N-terminal cleavage/methylation domain-containing protein